jgi:hypothetical protein
LKTRPDGNVTGSRSWRLFCILDVYMGDCQKACCINLSFRLMLVLSDVISEFDFDLGILVTPILVLVLFCSYAYNVGVGVEGDIILYFRAPVD